MDKHNLRIIVAAGCGMLLLILDGKTAIDGAADGIDLCLKTLIPSVFPFCFLSVMLTSALTGQNIPFLQPIASVCKIPRGAESLLAIGFLGGYPVGARNVAQIYRAGQITASQAARMITVCNNAGPAFIFGILGTMFTNPLVPWMLWGIHILSALLTGILLPGVDTQSYVNPAPQNPSLTEALEQTVKVMAPLCGWVVLMRMVLAFMERWFLWFLPTPVRVAISGILELANGCVRLHHLSDEDLRFIIASGLLSMGGICVTLQTASVTRGIPMKLYFPGKVLNCGISMMLSVLAAAFCFRTSPIHYPIAAVAAVLGVGSITAFHFSEKRSRIPALTGV